MTDSDSPATNPAPAANQGLPLDELELTPQWVKTSGKSFSEHAGAREPKRDGRRPDRERPRSPRPERPTGAGERRGPRPERRRGGGPAERRPGQYPAPKPQVPAVAPVEVIFQPEEKGFAGMIETIKQTPRAYALFDVSKLVLNKPERHHVKFSGKAAADGTRAPLFLVMPGENVFLRQDEAVRFALRHHAEMIFREKKTSIDPPKGNFAFVNRCGITGVWLGPPNYHEYQGRLVRHHQQRLRHMPFGEFQSRIQTVRDPDAIKAWVDSMSFKMEYECILDAEPKSFASRDELEKHFVENHLAQFVTSAPEVRISGVASRQLANPALLESVRLAWLEERRFPLKTANEMRGKLRHEGFHFFKDPKGATYVSRIKPQRFESIAHLTDQIQKIIAYLRENVRCKRQRLLAHFLTPLEATAAPPPPDTDAVASPVRPSEEERLLADLHWLIQDGYVVEFSDGRLWALPDKPPQPVPAPKPAPASETMPAATETSVAEAPAEPSPIPESVAPAPDGGEPNPGTPAASS
jgi:hypothetical protein